MGTTRDPAEGRSLPSTGGLDWGEQIHSEALIGKSLNKGNGRWIMTNQNAIRPRKKWNLWLKEGVIDPGGDTETQFCFQELYRASLVLQCLRICMLTQEIRAQSPVWKEPTCLGETRPFSAPQGLSRVLEPRSHKCWAHLPKQLKHKSPRSHPLQQKKLLKGYTCTPYTPQLERCPHSPQAEKTLCSNEDPAEPKRNSRKIKKTVR